MRGGEANCVLAWICLGWNGRGENRRRDRGDVTLWKINDPVEARKVFDAVPGRALEETGAI